jgi:peptide/nickel transport system permease protein
MAAVITAVFAVSLGLAAGFLRGWSDRVITNLFDILWSFPVLLFAIALGTALAIGGLSLGPINIQGDSLWIPIVIIGIVYVPYLGRPIRGQVLSLREKEFVDAAVAQGMRGPRIMFGEILPNVASTILVFGTLIIANNILTEAALSFLGAGIQPPEPSWGGLIADGVNQIYTAPHLSLVPGVAIVIAVLSLNVFGDGLRDALDPRAKVRLQ